MAHMVFAGPSQAHSREHVFAKGVTRKLRRFFQDGIRALDCMNLAVAEGKAIDRFRERMIDAQITPDICVVNGASRSIHERTLRIMTTATPSPGVRIQIYRILAVVNLRFGTNLQAELLVAHEQQKARRGFH